MTRLSGDAVLAADAHVLGKSPSPLQFAQPVTRLIKLQVPLSAL
jgi:hypothetical protein